MVGYRGRWGCGVAVIHGVIFFAVTVIPFVLVLRHDCVNNNVAVLLSIT